MPLEIVSIYMWFANLSIDLVVLSLWVHRLNFRMYRLSNTKSMHITKQKFIFNELWYMHQVEGPVD